MTYDKLETTLQLATSQPTHFFKADYLLLDLKATWHASRNKQAEQALRALCKNIGERPIAKNLQSLKMLLINLCEGLKVSTVSAIAYPSTALSFKKFTPKDNPYGITPYIQKIVIKLQDQGYALHRAIHKPEVHHKALEYLAQAVHLSL
ncbi:MAG: hypothetical protein VX730_03095 [Pseudomonadota bacterium]|nr:hypothetical protein [Pseudomonadota bacterium]